MVRVEKRVGTLSKSEGFDCAREVMNMDLAQEYFDVINDTTKLVAKEKAECLGSAASAFQSSQHLANGVEFWKWMGANYPKDLSTSQLIQQAANTKGTWLSTQIQGKGYEWDYMTSLRADPAKLFSKFNAGNSPTQPGIDITETNIFDETVKATYQNKAYLSTNNPNLHNTPKDAIVVTSSEKVPSVQKQGYETEKFMDAEEIQNARDARLGKASQGKVDTAYTVRNVANTAIKAGAVSAVIGITIETITSHRAWKDGELTDEEYASIKDIQFEDKHMYAYTTMDGEEPLTRIAVYFSS